MLVQEWRCFPRHDGVQGCLKVLEINGVLGVCEATRSSRHIECALRTSYDEKKKISELIVAVCAQPFGTSSIFSFSKVSKKIPNYQLHEHQSLWSLTRELKFQMIMPSQDIKKAGNMYGLRLQMVGTKWIWMLLSKLHIRKQV